MFKKLALALMPLALLATSVKADDDLTVDIASISDADVEIVENDLDINVDALTADAGTDTETAIEACFRRFGYNYRSWCGGHYHRCYNYCRPLYSYRTICYSAPVYRCFAPVYNYYWGCY